MTITHYPVKSQSTIQPLRPSLIPPWRRVFGSSLGALLAPALPAPHVDGLGLLRPHLVVPGSPPCTSVVVYTRLIIVIVVSIAPRLAHENGRVPIVCTTAAEVEAETAVAGAQRPQPRELGELGGAQAGAAVRAVGRDCAPRDVPDEPADGEAVVEGAQGEEEVAEALRRERDIVSAGFGGRWDV